MVYDIVKWVFFDCVDEFYVLVFFVMYVVVLWYYESECDILYVNVGYMIEFVGID